MDYLLLLEKAIVFIDDNLTEEIRVEEVAASVGYSYYHFQRVLTLFWAKVSEIIYGRDVWLAPLMI